MGRIQGPVQRFQIPECSSVPLDGELTQDPRRRYTHTHTHIRTLMDCNPLLYKQCGRTDNHTHIHFLSDRVCCITHMSSRVPTVPFGLKRKKRLFFLFVHNFIFFYLLLWGENPYIFEVLLNIIIHICCKKLKDIQKRLKINKVSFRPHNCVLSCSLMSFMHLGSKSRSYSSVTSPNYS